MYYRQDYENYSLFAYVFGYHKNGNGMARVYATDRKKVYKTSLQNMSVWNPCNKNEIEPKILSKLQN